MTEINVSVFTNHKKQVRLTISFFSQKINFILSCDVRAESEPQIQNAKCQKTKAWNLENFLIFFGLILAVINLKKNSKFK